MVLLTGRPIDASTELLARNVVERLLGLTVELSSFAAMARDLFGIDAPSDYESVEHLVARWHPYAGFVYSLLLLDSLSGAGLVARR